MEDVREQFDAYVVCSTLNQVVNYIPYKYFDINKNDIYFITIGNKEEYKKLAEKERTFSANRRFNNYEWDKNLKEVIGIKKKNTCNTLFIPEENIYSMEEIRNSIEKYLEEHINKKKGCSQILWNITGGQRSLSLVIKEIYENRKNENHHDKIIYLEGNTNHIIMYNYVKDKNINRCYYQYKFKKYGLHDGDFDMKTILALAGFKDIRDKEYINYLKSNEELEQKIFSKLYKEIKSNNKLRDEFVSLNKKNKPFFTQREKVVSEKVPKKKNDEENTKERSKARRDFLRDFLKNTIKEIKAEEYNEIFKFIDEFKNEKEQVIEYLVENFGSDGFVFGRIFEYICLYGIKQEIEEMDNEKSYFVDLSLSRRIGFSEEERYSNEVDEIDILLLSASGQIISFECKSGGMDGNNAKSHNYTTYALAGVYGMPRLLAPLTEKEIYKEDEDLSREREDLLKESFSAINMAKKANMKVWGIDQIEEELKEIVNMANVNEGR